MNHALLFVSICAFLVSFGVIYLLGEINVSRGSIHVRNRIVDVYEEGVSFCLWFWKREGKLWEIWEAEVCEDMQMGFEEWCWAVFKEEFRIVYLK